MEKYRNVLFNHHPPFLLWCFRVPQTGSLTVLTPPHHPLPPSAFVIITCENFPPCQQLIPVRLDTRFALWLNISPRRKPHPQNTLAPHPLVISHHPERKWYTHSVMPTLRATFNCPCCIATPCCVTIAGCCNFLNQPPIILAGENRDAITQWQC